MSSSLGTLILILTFGRTSGNSVKQTDQITVLEGASVTMNCTYTSTLYPTLFWYVQYANKTLQFLQRETMENSKNFGARNIKDKTSPITKSSVQVSDSAVYYCLLRDTHSAKGRGAVCTKTSGAQVTCVVSLGTRRRGDLFSLLVLLGLCWKIKKYKINCNCL